jgi:hypothetical protein
VTEFKSFNLFLNRMAKKKTTQGIGYINNNTEFDNLVTKVASIITEEFNRTSDNATAINNVKRSIDNLVGRTRQSFTKTDVYQVSYLMFYSILNDTAEAQNRTFKETQVNTLVAKLMTEGEYGNPSVVRRQTTDAKLTELKRRLFPSLVGGIFGFANYVYYSLSGAQQRDLNSVARRMAVRGSRSTSTTRVSNRTRRTTTPRSTTPRATTPAAAPSQVTESSSPVNATFVVVERQVRQLNVDTSEGKKLLLLKVMVYFKLVAREKINPLVARTPNTQLNNVNLRQIMSDTFIPLQAMRPEGTKDIRHCIELISYGLYGNRINQAKRILPYQQWRSQSTGYFSRAYINNLSREYRYNTIMGNAFVKFFNPTISISYFITRMVRFSDTNRYPVTELQQILGTARDIVEMYVPDSSVSTSAPTATVTEINVPGYTSEATPAAPAPPPPVDNLIRNMKITDEWDFGIEWEHFGLGFPKLKKAMEKIGQPIYPDYVPKHYFEQYDMAIKPGLFPNGKVNKGWWVMQIDGSLRVDYGEPASEFRNTKMEANVSQRTGTYDTYKGELVSPVLGGKRGLAIIKLVGNTLVNLGMRHNPSMGMHTHVTKRGFNRTNIKNLMYNYVAMEPLIEAMMEPNRRSTAPGQYNRSHFIQLELSLISTETQVKNKLKSNILDISDDQFYYKFGTSKQQAVNLKPFYGANTIEFRQQGANFEADSVTMWIAFLFYFCQFSKKKRFQNFQWNNLVSIMPVGLASFWYNRIQDLTGKSPYELSFRK